MQAYFVHALLFVFLAGSIFFVLLAAMSLHGSFLHVAHVVVCPLGLPGFRWGKFGRDSEMF